jgi:exodeoxyribonuclease VII small subunit
MNNQAAEQLNFEKALAELEHVVKALEDGQVGLEESLALYEKGVALVRRCQGKLGQVEQRILELLGQDETGKTLTAPFQHTASWTK